MVVADLRCPWCAHPLVDAATHGPPPDGDWAPLPEALFYQCVTPGCAGLGLVVVCGELQRVRQQLAGQRP